MNKGDILLCDSMTTNRTKESMMINCIEGFSHVHTHHPYMDFELMSVFNHILSQENCYSSRAIYFDEKYFKLFLAASNNFFLDCCIE